MKGRRVEFIDKKGSTIAVVVDENNELSLENFFRRKVNRDFAKKAHIILICNEWSDDK